MMAAPFFFLEDISQHHSQHTTPKKVHSIISFRGGFLRGLPLRASYRMVVWRYEENVLFRELDRKWHGLY